jgi:beta-glucanase (GH16 family)
MIKRNKINMKYYSVLLALLVSPPLLALESYDLPSGEWRQISLPVDPGGNNTVRAIFEDDIVVGDVAVTYGDDWVMYAYDSAAGAYQRKELDDTLMQGVGYWITQLTGRSVQLDMPEGSVAGADPFSVPLVSPGAGGSVQWNMVGHPLDVSVKFSDYKIITASGTCEGQGCSPSDANQNTVFLDSIWRYRGGGYEVVSGDILVDPWDGFWCAALASSADLNPQIVIASVESPPPGPRPPIDGDWSLSFKDEFEGSTLDHSKWRIGGHYLGTSSHNIANSAEQLSVQNGNLKLSVKKAPLGFAGKGFDYVGSEVSTYQKFNQLYGYYEARIKYAAVQGVWPAFWTMPDRGDPKTDTYGNKNLAYESYMRFDLSDISEPVASALLKVKVTALALHSSPGNKLVNVTVHKLLSNDWDEQTITWDNKPNYDPVWLYQAPWIKPSQGAASTVPQEELGFTNEEYAQAQLDSNKNTLYLQNVSQASGGSLSASANESLIEEVIVGQEIVVDVTQYINSQIAAHKDSAGFALADTFMRLHKISFGSREAENIADRPQLEIGDSRLYPVADAYVRAGTHSSENYGSESKLEVEDPWMQTSSTQDGGMEVDILESLGIWGADKVQHAVHWNGYVQEHRIAGSGKVDVSPTDDGYHTYGMNWQPGRIDFYIDGVKSAWSFVDDRVGSVASYVLLSHQLGGWDNNSIVDNLLPASMLVDYVRVWSGTPSP